MVITMIPNTRNTIRVQECAGWFKVDIIFENPQDVDYIFSKIPKSYRMRIQNYSDGSGTWQRIITTHIVLKPTELTGSKNETGISRIIKIKQKLRELLPHFKVYTQTFVPVPESRDSYRYDKVIEGWI